MSLYERGFRADDEISEDGVVLPSGFFKHCIELAVRCSESMLRSDYPEAIPVGIDVIACVHFEALTVLCLPTFGGTCGG
jgi:hypothetical protein